MQPVERGEVRPSSPTSPTAERRGDSDAFASSTSGFRVKRTSAAHRDGGARDDASGSESKGGRYWRPKIQRVTQMNRMTATLIGLTAAALLLSGCAPTSAPDSKPAATGKPVVISTSTQSATPALAIPGDVSGDGKLDGWERERLAAASYGLPNGTKVALPALGAPLPASVVRAVQAHVLAQGNLAAVPGDEKNAVDAKAIAVVDAESQRLGRMIVPVVRVEDGDGHAAG